MFCRNCGNQMDQKAVVCIKCGVPVGTGVNFCMNCGEPTASQAVVCVKCGCTLSSVQNSTGNLSQKSKVAAGILGIFLGSLGVHNFYLGYTAKAIIQLCLSVAGWLFMIPTFGVSVILNSASGIWGLIEGIMILVGKIDKDAKGLTLQN